MQDWIALAPTGSALLLIAAGLLPSSLANRHSDAMRIGITRAVSLQLMIAIIAALCLLWSGRGSVTTPLATLPAPFNLSILFDGISALMLVLVSFVGWNVCRYSIRYLDGEQNQGRYFRWIGFTIGAVSLLVISGDLLLLMGCWLCTSWGLHQLLLHYPDRPAAQRAAWTKFAISRIGDAALLAAIVLIYARFDTLNLTAIFAQLEQSDAGSDRLVGWAGWMLAVGAITKSAQFPFHTWLPLTMETPTPVSALMHAGIVNAGGYLLIRTSPLIAHAPGTLAVVAIVGTITVCFAAVVMLTQTSVKKSLAYSTMAQMGFMMLQCGLGAFSAALLHIVAHSLYKAHAFLNSGSVIVQRRASSGGLQPRTSLHVIKTAIAFVLLMSFLVAAFAEFGVDIGEKPGGWLLGTILCLGLAGWVGESMRLSRVLPVLRTLTVALVLCSIYVGSFIAVDRIAAPHLPAVSTGSLIWPLATVVLFGFISIFTLQLIASRGMRPNWISTIYVHASNGFYVESTMRRALGVFSNH